MGYMTAVVIFCMQPLRVLITTTALAQRNREISLIIRTKCSDISVWPDVY